MERLNSTVTRIPNAYVDTISEHLIDLNGDADCCLYAKGEVCICDKFVHEDVKVVVPLKGKLPKKQEVQVLEDPRMNSYVLPLEY